MTPRPPGYTRTDTLFPYTTLFRSFLLTPIIWHADNMPPGSLRGTLMRFNPFYHLVELVRAPILGQSIDVSTPMYLAVMTVGGWIIAVVAYRRYARYVPLRSEEHTSELQSLMRISYAVFCLKK